MQEQNCFNLTSTRRGYWVKGTQQFKNILMSRYRLSQRCSNHKMWLWCGLRER